MCKVKAATSSQLPTATDIRMFAVNVDSGGWVGLG